VPHQESARVRIGPDFSAVAGAPRVVEGADETVLHRIGNAKVALALTERAAVGQVPAGAKVVMFNTGGTPAIYQYAAGLAGTLE